MRRSAGLAQFQADLLAIRKELGRLSPTGIALKVATCVILERVVCWAHGKGIQNFQLTLLAAGPRSHGSLALRLQLLHLKLRKAYGYRMWS